MSKTIYFFFFNDTATTEIYTLSLHDALPISHGPGRDRRPGRQRRGRRALPRCEGERHRPGRVPPHRGAGHRSDRKSTRLNSSHSQISYAVFCLKKKTSEQLLVYGSCLLGDST